MFSYLKHSGWSPHNVVLSDFMSLKQVQANEKNHAYTHVLLSSTLCTFSRLPSRWSGDFCVCHTRGVGGTPYVMGDTYVPRFWPPFFTLAGSSTIFVGYFSHPPTAELSFGVQKLPIFTKIDLFGPKFNFFLDLFGSNFQRPAAHPHQFSGRVPPQASPAEFRHKLQDRWVLKWNERGQ